VKLIDSHCHLNYEGLAERQTEVLDAARAAGVTGFLNISTRQREWGDVIAVAEANDDVWATVGVHPHEADAHPDLGMEALSDAASHQRVIAIGECGLDYFRDFSPRDVQRTAFARQLEIAARVNKPVFLHQRDAHADFVAILREHESVIARGAVAHCFTGSAHELHACLELGLAIGITGWINDERRGAHLLPLLRDIPADRLMIETDGPYLLPRDLQPKPASRRNEPAYLPHIARAVAQARGESLEQLAQTTTAAARRFFGLPEKPVASH